MTCSRDLSAPVVSCAEILDGMIIWATSTRGPFQGGLLRVPLDRAESDTEDEEGEGEGEGGTGRRPAIKDQAIVNMAVINLLNAVTLGTGSGRWWSPERKSFQALSGTNARGERVAFEARVDGHLQDVERPWRTHALVEVKRTGRNDKVRMQEGAEMVAWILESAQSAGKPVQYVRDKTASRALLMIILLTSTKMAHHLAGPG